MKFYWNMKLIKLIKQFLKFGLVGKSTNYIQILTLPLNSYVILRRLLNLSVLHFSNL